MSELSDHQYALQQIRKALTGDIHSTSDLLEDISALLAKVEQIEERWRNAEAAWQKAYSEGFDDAKRFYTNK